jgi:hypothetical protein
MSQKSLFHRVGQAFFIYGAENKKIEMDKD